MPEPKTVYLKATYTSPAQPEPQVLSSTALSLPTRQEGQITVGEKTTYLSSLRAATIALQESVNAALTARMEEDAARAAKDTSADKCGEAKSKGADEVAEEENYGEEVAEDDE